MALFDLWLCGAASFMEESELVKESEGMKCEGVISGCKAGDLKKNGKRKAKKRG